MTHLMAEFDEADIAELPLTELAELDESIDMDVFRDMALQT